MLAKSKQKRPNAYLSARYAVSIARTDATRVSTLDAAHRYLGLFPMQADYVVADSNRLLWLVEEARADVAMSALKMHRITGFLWPPHWFAFVATHGRLWLLLKAIDNLARARASTSESERR